MREASWHRVAVLLLSAGLRVADMKRGIDKVSIRLAGDPGSLWIHLDADELGAVAATARELHHPDAERLWSEACTFPLAVHERALVRDWLDNWHRVRVVRRDEGFDVIRLDRRCWAYLNREQLAEAAAFAQSIQHPDAEDLAELLHSSI